MRIMYKNVKWVLAFIALTVTSNLPVIAAERGASIYTKLEIEKNCQLGQKYEEGQGAEWWCPGIEGIDVLVAEGDLRYFLGYGPNAKKQKSFSQTLSPFNYIGKTLEWRVKTLGGRKIPYATILRYHTDFDGKKGQVLVVTKISGEDACHIAYINALTIPQANVLAREAADNLSPNFNCNESRPKIIGN